MEGLALIDGSWCCCCVSVHQFEDGGREIRLCAQGGIDELIQLGGCGAVCFVECH